MMSIWEGTIQQLREAFPFECNKKYLIHDRDSIFSKAVREAIEAIGMRSMLTGFRSPWMNGVAERFVQTARNDLLNNVIIFNEKHLRRLMKDYIDYYNNDRSHLANGRDSPYGREVQQKPDSKCQVVAIPKVGGLQHKYIWKKTA